MHSIEAITEWNSLGVCVCVYLSVDGGVKGNEQIAVAPGKAKGSQKKVSVL